MKLITNFRYDSHKDDRVTIFMDNKAVTNLRGKNAIKFLSKVQNADSDLQQLIMAKATGNFKRGNERQ